MDINKQVKELREKSEQINERGTAFPSVIKLLNDAADTIESLSAKLSAANIKLETNECAKNNIIKKIEKQSIGELPLKRPFVYLSNVIDIINNNEDNWFPGYYRENWILCNNRMPIEYKYPLIGRQSSTVLVTMEFDNHDRITTFQNSIDGKWNSEYFDQKEEKLSHGNHYQTHIKNLLKLFKI